MLRMEYPFYFDFIPQRRADGPGSEKIQKMCKSMIFLGYHLSVAGTGPIL